MTGKALHFDRNFKKEMNEPETDNSPTVPVTADGNNLFPVFLKLETLRLLIVGGGNVALEKLHAVLRNAPATRIKLVAKEISPEIRMLAATADIVLEERPYQPDDLEDIHIALVAVNSMVVAEVIRKDAHIRGILVNVADTPALCDFYLGAVAKKGSLKIAISTDGKSPTIARRLKEVLEDSLPDETDSLLEHMHRLRSRMKGDFAEKVRRLNRLTGTLAAAPDRQQRMAARRWRKIAAWSLFAFCFLVAGNLVASYVSVRDIGDGLLYVHHQLDQKFYWMLLAGFLAQLVDGALGMGYGVTCASVLLATGVPLPAISSSIHTAEMFSSGASGFSHYKFGNVNKKLFRLILLPGILGAVLGAWLLAAFGDAYAGVFRPLLASYTLFLGIRIVFNAFRKKRRGRKLKRVGWLAGAGGFLDSFGGGGWGPLVTSTLLSKGKTPKYVIGTVSITEFFVTLASALTFFSIIGLSHWQVILGLIIGGVIAAPIAARLAGRLPLKTMFIAVGAMVIFWSLHILVRALL